MSTPDPATTDWVPLWSLGAPAQGLVGAPIPWLVSAIPAGYLEFNGQTITSAAYPQLYALFGATLPDLTGKVLMGQNATYPIATSGGAATHTLAESEMPAHDHSPINVVNMYAGRAYSGNTGLAEQTGYITGANGWTGLGSGSIIGASMASKGASGSHNNLQPYRTVRWITIAG